MNNNTNSNGIQSRLSPDQIMASLGLATRLSEQLLRSQNPMQEAENPMQEEPTNAPQTLETAPGSEETLDLEVDEPLEEKEPSFVADLKSMITEGFENIKGLFKKEEKLEPKE